MSALDDVIVGDLVKLTKGERIIQGRVQSDNGHLFVPYTWSNSGLVGRNRGPRIQFADSLGWTLEVVERAPRPAVPGIYTDKEGDVYLRTGGKDYRLTNSADPRDRTVEARPGAWLTEAVTDGPGATRSAFAPFTLLAKLSDLS